MRNYHFSGNGIINLKFIMNTGDAVVLIRKLIIRFTATCGQSDDDLHLFVTLIHQNVTQKRRILQFCANYAKI